MNEHTISLEMNVPLAPLFLFYVLSSMWGTCTCSPVTWLDSTERSGGGLVDVDIDVFWRSRIIKFGKTYIVLKTLHQQGGPCKCLIIFLVVLLSRLPEHSAEGKECTPSIGTR